MSSKKDIVRECLENYSESLNLLKYLESNDYIKYNELFQKLPESVKRKLPDALELVIENGDFSQFKHLYKMFIANNNEYVYDYITDCAYNGELKMLDKIIQNCGFIAPMALSNSLVFALQEKHYDIAEYLLERNVNNILAYDYILQNKSYSEDCEYLYKMFGKRMETLYSNENLN